MTAVKTSKGYLVVCGPFFVLFFRNVIVGHQPGHLPQQRTSVRSVLMVQQTAKVVGARKDHPKPLFYFSRSIFNRFRWF
jgi:hypothetical protein